VANATNSVNINGASTVAMLTGITLNQANSAGNTMSSLLVSNGATLYLGGVGLLINQPSSTVFAAFGNGTATVGAVADWSSTAPITLAGTTTFKRRTLRASPTNFARRRFVRQWWINQDRRRPAHADRYQYLQRRDNGQFGKILVTARWPAAARSPLATAARWAGRARSTVR